VPVPFQHHTRKLGSFDDKLAPNLKEPVGKTKVNKWWKSILVPWRGLHVLIIRYRELKGQTAIVCDVAFGRKNLGGLAVFVELETFGSTKWWIEYEHTVEEW